MMRRQAESERAVQIGIGKRTAIGTGERTAVLRLRRSMGLLLTYFSHPYSVLFIITTSTCTVTDTVISAGRAIVVGKLISDNTSLP
jgi:hypothetical protein